MKLAGSLKTSAWWELQLSPCHRDERETDAKVGQVGERIELNEMKQLVINQQTRLYQQGKSMRQMSYGPENEWSEKGQPRPLGIHALTGCKVVFMPTRD